MEAPQVQRWRRCCAMASEVNPSSLCLYPVLGWGSDTWLKFRSSPVPVLSGFYGTMAWAAWLRTASPLPHVVPRPGRLRVRFCTRAGANVCLGFVSPSSWTGPDLGTAKGRYGGSCRATFHWLLALRLARLYLGR